MRIAIGLTVLLNFVNKQTHKQTDETENDTM